MNREVQCHATWSGAVGGPGDDLAIGAPWDTVNTLEQAGSVSVIYGSTNGLTKAGDDLFHRGTPGIAGALKAGDRFGHALAAGDFDNDGFDELTIGVPFDDVGSTVDAGSVQVLRGGSNGLRTGGDKIWHRAKSGIRGAKGTDDLFGSSLTTGRFNSDGRDDLAIGVHNDTIGTAIGVGSVYVLYGAGSGLTAAGDQIWHQGRRGIAGANEAGDAYGYSVATGDFNGNGIDDLLIGAPFEDIQTTVDAGKVGVIYGRSGGLAAGGDQKWSQDSAGIRGVAEAGDYMGMVAGADATTDVALNAIVSLEGAPFFTDGWGGGLTVAPETVVDGIFLRRGNQWDRGPVWWDSHDGQARWIEMDLGATFDIESLIVQADDNEAYVVYYWDLSTSSWQLLWDVPTSTAWDSGMQTRPNPADDTEHYVLTTPVVTNALKIEGNMTSGDKYFSVSEVQAFGTRHDPGW